MPRLRASNAGTRSGVIRVSCDERRLLLEMSDSATTECVLVPLATAPAESPGIMRMSLNRYVVASCQG